ncbi:type IA DNA topoisomerase [Lederbergia galactosidilytica]|uniref:DNA topoisomerase n=1 Tax=Lederbergia galactosidilytica TaxID=217031 RepID=A0A177ZHB9_9BACI|nr:type IA DNA topoisomerase [Lederbergia galactosidilytica]KRG15379.1 DNA topoisomerase III [Virgibacillus soli]OAK67164.1 DNA topoisomerase III [Lederbergia galactosidilytica]
MKPVILAEKPSQAKAYADAFTTRKYEGYIEISPCSIFANGAYLTWGVGHLVELKEPHTYNPAWKRWSLESLPILPDHYEFQVAKGKAKQFNIVKKLIRSTDTVINACDVDREGSNIFYSIYNQTGARGQTIKRLWINSLEADEVRNGFADLRDNQKDLQLYEEAKARQISDWLVGMNGSRLYTLLMKKKGIQHVFPIGRVQSPTVYLIYQRQREIETFVSEPFFEVEAQFTAQHGPYKGKAKIKEAKRELVAKQLNDRHIRPNTPGTITDLSQTEKRMPPPQLHSLSSLQATANRRWKTSPATVLKTMQMLYEKKLVSYPRTDTRYITPAEFSYLVASIEDLQGLIEQPFAVASRTPKKRFVDSSKVQEHYAIIPTKKRPTKAALAKLSSLERNLYEEIIRTTLAMFHRDYLYTETKVTTTVKGLPFFSIGKTERDKGWKELFPPSKRSKNSDEPALPPLNRDETVQSEIGITEGKTQPPKPYTEGQLITMMKTCGKLVEDQMETNVLKEIEGLGTEATRSGIIETIKKHDYINVTKNIVTITDKGRILCQAIEGNLLASPSMTAKWETYLRKIGNGEGTGTHFLDNIGKFIHKLLQEVPEQLAKQQLDITLPPASSRKSRYQPKEVAPCPACGKGTIIARKSFYGCSNYKNGCKQTFPGTFLKKKLTPTQIKLLCTKGRTNVIKGFTTSTGKKFDAPLELKNGKLELDFKQ